MISQRSATHLPVLRHYPAAVWTWNKLLLATVLSFIHFVAEAQLPFVLRIARQPADPAAVHYVNAQEVELGREIAPPSKTGGLAGDPWIVYSDRENNTTFRRPNGLTKFRKMAFMEAFYVIQEKNGYLKLIKYDSGIPVGNMFSKRVITDRSKIRHVGWAPKSRLLLTNQCYRTADTRRAELVSGTLSYTRLLTNPQEFLSNDSVRLYADPGKQQARTVNMPLYSLAYVYKRSDSGREILIGRAPWFMPDSVKPSILGWVSAEMLQSIGRRLFIEADTSQPVANQTPLYKSLTAALARKKDSVLIPGKFPAVSWTSFGHKFPVLSRCPPVDSTVVIKTQVLLPLFASRRLPIVSVSGQKLTTTALTAIKRGSSRYNMIFVVEESVAMKPYWDELRNAVQFTVTQRLRDTISGISSLQVGAVLYGGIEQQLQVRKSNVRTLNLTTEYSRLFNFLNTHTPPAGTIYAGPQPVRHGILNALRLVADHPEENNIILLIGLTGDNQGVSEWDDVAAALQKTACRLLCFQKFAFDELTANDFVLQSKELLLKSGKAGSILKQEKLVDPTLVTYGTSFDLRLGDRNVYQLAYPDRSMVPGWVLFPRKKQPLLFKEFVAATDSLFRQVVDENRKTIAALHTAYEQAETMGKIINPALNELSGTTGTFLVADYQDLRNRVGTSCPLLVPAFLPLHASRQQSIKYIALLNADDYDELAKWMDQLSADELEPTSFIDRIRLKLVIRSVMRESGLAGEPIDNLGQLLERLSELPVRNPLLVRVSLRHLDDDEMVPDALLVQALYLLRERRDYLRRIPTFRNSRFQSNGQTYYWLSEDIFK